MLNTEDLEWYFSKQRDVIMLVLLLSTLLARIKKESLFQEFVTTNYHQFSLIGSAKSESLTFKLSDRTKSITNFLKFDFPVMLHLVPGILHY